MKHLILLLLALCFSACSHFNSTEQGKAATLNIEPVSIHERLFLDAYFQAYTDNYPRKHQEIRSDLLQVLSTYGDERYAQELASFQQKYGDSIYAEAANILLTDDLSSWPKTQHAVFRAPKI